MAVEEMLRYPVDPQELDRLAKEIGTKKTSKPIVFIYGMGLWVVRLPISPLRFKTNTPQNLDVQAALNFLIQVENLVTNQLPHLRASPSNPRPFYPRLFVTPNASGIQKADEWLQSQGNKALMLFEESMREIARERPAGMEVLGTWNATIQMWKYDGV